MNEILKEIKMKLLQKGKSIQWLVDEIEMPRSTFYRKTECDSFTKSEKRYIDELLEEEMK